MKKASQENELNTGLFNKSDELLNDHESHQIYYTNLMEQWKTANEMAANISEQRSETNSFFITAMSILFGGLLIGENGDVTNTTRWIVIIACSVGMMCCINWFIQLKSYSKMNGAKYEVINELEKKLPANVMNYEWSLTQTKDKYKYTSFSKLERYIPFVFMAAFAITIILMIHGIVLSGT